MSLGLSSSKNKSKQQSQSTSLAYNQAYPYISSIAPSTIEQGNRASSAIASLLGLNGAPAQTDGFDNFRNSAGYNFIRDQGIDGITTSNAAKGLLNSGSTLRGISEYSSNLARQFLDSYLQNLGGLSNTGISFADLLTRAGNTSNSQSTSTGSSSGSSFGFNVGLKK